MYNHLVNATKNRVIQELKDYFSRHPVFKTLEIYNRFPFNERIQEGIIIKNSSANRTPISADNFQGNVYNYVTFANYKNFPGLSLEWVREDDLHLSTYYYRQDFSGNLSNTLPTGGTSSNPLNVIVTLNESMVKGGTNLNFADSASDVEVFVNNSKVIPIKVDGLKKEITIPVTPVLNPTVEVSYFARNLAPAGVYQLEIISGDPVIGKFNFMVDCLLDKEEVVIENALGTETTVQLSSYPLYKGSLRLKENNSLMEENVDYYVDESTGIITFNSTFGSSTVLKNSSIVATYRATGLSTGPFEIPQPNFAHNTAIPGVVLAFGRAVSIGDKHFVVISKKRELTALEYSGKWDMGISLDAYAKDTNKIEEILDLATSYLNTYRKSDLDAEGIALVNVSFGGESEQIFDDATGDLYYMGSVEYTFLTEWIMHKPLLQTFDGYTVSVGELVEPKPYYTNLDLKFATIT